MRVYVITQSCLLGRSAEKRRREKCCDEKRSHGGWCVFQSSLEQSLTTKILAFQKMSLKNSAEGEPQRYKMRCDGNRT